MLTCNTQGLSLVEQVNELLRQQLLVGGAPFLRQIHWSSEPRVHELLNASGGDLNTKRLVSDIALTAQIYQLAESEL